MGRGPPKRWVVAGSVPQSVRLVNSGLPEASGEPPPGLVGREDIRITFYGSERGTIAHVGSGL